MFVFLVALLFLGVGAQQADLCSFSDSAGYFLRWHTSNGNVYFNLTFTNFPRNSYTGVGFSASDSNDDDLIVVQMTGYSVKVVDASVTGTRPPVTDADNSVVTSSASFRDNTLRAEFYRPIQLRSAGDVNLSGCKTWRFLTEPKPTPFESDSTFNTETQKERQVCDIATQCSMHQNDGSLGSTFWQTLTNTFNGNQQNALNNRLSTSNSFQRNDMPSTSTPSSKLYGYTENTATTPRPQAYTGTPFVYRTTPTSSQNSQQELNSNSINNLSHFFNNARMRDQQTNMLSANSPSAQYSNPNYSNLRNSNYHLDSQRWFSPSSQRPMSTDYQYYTPMNQQQPNFNQQGIPRDEPYFGSSQAFQSPYYQDHASNQQASFNPQQLLSSYRAPDISSFRNDYGWDAKIKRSSDRQKRQTNNYQPTDNIYGYDYSSNAQDSTSLVLNPNYKFLSGNLADEYSRTYSDAVRQYDQPSANSANQPPLSNSQQNQVNYQQIQRDYAINPNPTAGNTYSNNPYGYDYSSSSSGSSNPSPSTTYYTPSTASSSSQRDSTSLFYAANPSSTTQSPFATRQLDESNTQFQQTQPYESASNLKQTVLRDPTTETQTTSGVSGVQRDDPSGTANFNSPPMYTYYDPATAMYYPYRTETNFQTGSSGSASGSSGVLFDSTTGRMRDGSDACNLQDPYWCDYYVNLYLTTQEQYNFSTKQMACQSLITSLEDSYNGCCQTVRNAGCQA